MGAIDMTRKEALKEMRLSSFVDGYAYQADVYCDSCAREIASELAREEPESEDTVDTEDFPIPIFFGEHEERQYCAACGEYLYGGNLE
jgi:hypothetical protein